MRTMNSTAWRRMSRLEETIIRSTMPTTAARSPEPLPRFGQREQRQPSVLAATLAERRDVLGGKL